MRYSIFVGAIALLISHSTYAQTRNDIGGPATGRPAQQPDGWSVTLGAAPLLGPAWQGSKDMVLSIYPDIRVNYGDAFFASVPDGIGWNAVNQGGWKVGPVAKVRFGRDEERGGSPFRIAGGSDALRGLGDVGVAGEVGGFVEKSLGARRQWRLRGEVRQGFGGHEGVIADLSLAYRGRAGRTAFSIGPRATLVGASFARTYFGIDAGQSQRSGLAPYSPGGGLLSAGVGGSLVRPLDRRSAITLFTGFDRLGRPATRSPLIEQRGSANQFTIGIGYGYRFNL